MIALPTPPGFRYWPTLHSHGWLALAPFEYDAATHALARAHRLNDGTVMRWTVRPGDDDSVLGLRVDTRLTLSQLHEVEACVARCFHFDLDLADFYAALRDHPTYQWVERAGAGRFLVSPTVWEDLAKTLLTTNTTWRQTREMVRRLTDLGDPHSDGTPTFPTPGQIAAYDPDALNDHVRAGYRGAYLHELATNIAAGRFDAESLRDPQMDSRELYRRITQLKGFGAYAAGAMMRLLGHFDELGIDSVARTMFKDLHNNGEKPTDAQIRAYYAPFDRWQGLVVWMDVIRDDFADAAAD